MDQDRNLEAGNEFEEAVRLAQPKPDFESAFNAGVAFRLAGKLDKAETFYRKAAQIRPEDSSTHMNLGAMLHLVGKLEEAESEYLLAWKLNPGDIATKTNIKRLQNIMRSKGIEVKPVNL